jgi:hypothetical protein
MGEFSPVHSRHEVPMTTKILTVFVFAFLILNSQTAGQRSGDSISVGGTEFRLGMAQGAVLQQVGQVYDVQEVKFQPPHVSGWMVEEKGKPQKAISSLFFKDGKLNSIYKYWTVDEPNTEAAYANAIYGALNSFEREGKTQCTIHTDQVQGPQRESKAIFMTCGQKYLRLDIGRDENLGEYATLAEVLEYSNKN